MRLVNRLLAAIIAAGIAAAGFLTAAEVLVARTGWPHDPPLVVPYDRWLSSLRPHAWDQPAVRIGCIGAIVVGLLLVGAAVFGRERRVRLLSDRPDVDTSTSYRSVERALRNEAAMIDAVTHTSAHVGRSTAKVDATIRLGDPRPVEERLHAAVHERISELAPVLPPRVTVSVHAVRSRE